MYNVCFIFDLKKFIYLKHLMKILVGTLFIDIVDIYCFGSGLSISMPEDIYQYHDFK